MTAKDPERAGHERTVFADGDPCCSWPGCNERARYVNAFTDTDGTKKVFSYCRKHIKEIFPQDNYRRRRPLPRVSKPFVNRGTYKAIPYSQKASFKLKQKPRTQKEGSND